MGKIIDYIARGVVRASSYNDVSDTKYSTLNNEGRLTDYAYGVVEGKSDMGPETKNYRDKSSREPTLLDMSSSLLERIVGDINDGSIPS